MTAFRRIYARNLSATLAQIEPGEARGLLGELGTGKTTLSLAVMRAGKFVELATAENILNSPQHEYTRQLLAAVPEVPA